MLYFGQQGLHKQAMHLSPRCEQSKVPASLLGSKHAAVFVHIWQSSFALHFAVLYER